MEEVDHSSSYSSAEADRRSALQDAKDSRLEDRELDRRHNASQLGQEEADALNAAQASADEVDAAELDQEEEDAAYAASLAEEKNYQSRRHPSRQQRSWQGSISSYQYPSSYQ
jgi:hypothetical protein